MSFVAASYPLPRKGPIAMALGAYLKNTICVAAGDRAYLSPVIGDLGTPEAIQKFEEIKEGLCRELAVRPELIAHDLHPDFHSTRAALNSGRPTLAVQHHHAHVAAAAAENMVDRPVIGLGLDGFGLGPGNQAWGGELILDVGDGAYRRLGHLAPMAQPGGDIAAREPWRMGAAILHRLGRGGEIAGRFKEQRAAALLAQIIDKNLNCPQTTSAGRLFDAACGLLGVRPVAEFEGQAPMELEKMVRTPAVMVGGWTLNGGVLDFLPLMERLAGLDPAQGADLFHGTLIEGMAEWAGWASRETGLTEVALSGGCFFNAVLRNGLAARLSERGLTPLPHRSLSPGDPGLSVGQAWIAVRHLMRQYGAN